MVDEGLDFLENELVRGRLDVSDAVEVKWSTSSSSRSRASPAREVRPDVSGVRKVGTKEGDVSGETSGGEGWVRANDLEEV